LECWRTPEPKTWARQGASMSFKPFNLTPPRSNQPSSTQPERRRRLSAEPLDPRTRGSLEPEGWQGNR
jgi:hypothetical protein